MINGAVVISEEEQIVARISSKEEIKVLLDLDVQKIAYEFQREKQFITQKKIKRGGGMMDSFAPPD